MNFKFVYFFTIFLFFFLV